MDLQPTLSGELLLLRPLEESDYEALYKVASDPMIWEQHPNSDRYKPEVFREFFRDAMASKGALVAVDRQTDTVIGSSRFRWTDNGEASEVEIGWTFLARDHWGGKYNVEMKKLMLEHAFRYVDRVMFYIGSNNLRSQHALKKLGGVFVGSKPDGESGETNIYEITPAVFVKIFGACK